nr:hypothetical protein Iba_chr07eCG1260 [Ipomoea batatas]
MSALLGLSMFCRTLAVQSVSSRPLDDPPPCLRCSTHPSRSGHQIQPKCCRCIPTVPSASPSSALVSRRAVAVPAPVVPVPAVPVVPAHAVPVHVVLALVPVHAVLAGCFPGFVASVLKDNENSLFVAAVEEPVNCALREDNNVALFVAANLLVPVKEARASLLFRLLERLVRDEGGVGVGRQEEASGLDDVAVEMGAAALELLIVGVPEVGDAALGLDAEGGLEGVDLAELTLVGALLVALPRKAAIEEHQEGEGEGEQSGRSRHVCCVESLEGLEYGDVMVRSGEGKTRIGPLFLSVRSSGIFSP